MFRHAVAFPSLLLLGACAVQPAYQRPAIDAPGAWDNASAGAPPTLPADRESWWTQLGDAGVDALVAAGLRDNPTLAEAAARVEQARAALAVQNAQRLPAVAVEGNVTGSRDGSQQGSGTTGQVSAALGASLSWELDLWGRVRESAAAARHRLAARTADAEGARLSLIGDIADAALALRACHLTRDIRDRDIASREVELRISRSRLSFGAIAPVVVAAAESNLAAARTERIAQDERCRQLVAALVALSGVEAGAVREVLAPLPLQRSSIAALPEPPSFAPALPATVLLGHPRVIAAEREAAARWSEIGVARAERLPRIDLVGLLTGHWIRALGSSSTHVSGSAAAQLAGPLFDGGAGLANVRGAEAGYREALAQLDVAVRDAVRDIEDALAAQQSAALRIETSRQALEAARFTLAANEARWRAGAIGQLELEEARRQFNNAQESAVTAAADRVRAWVAMMRRTGPAGGATAAGAAGAVRRTSEEGIR